mgnify:CR=1 FL=1
MRATVDALYVHVPFCWRVCGYCDFYSEVFDRPRIEPLVDALGRELDSYRARVDLRPRTIFIGGGTPTTLPPPTLARLLAACRQDARTGPDFEFTVEANPATVTPAIAETLAAGGVTRVSIGAQSFDPAELAILDRQHRPEQVAQTVATCREHGLTHISLDLIFAIPGQTLAGWRANLRTALELDPEHLSCYGLTYEPGTPLHERWQAGAVQRVDSDVEADMYEATIDDLAAAGLPQYEISNYARPGAECRHNLVYWRNEPYLGIGPSAAGFVDETRYRNVPDTAAYVAAITAGRSPRVEEERLDPLARQRETAMLGLRLRAGIDRAAFRARFGVDATDTFATVIARYVADELLEVTDTHIRLTRRGVLVADRVAADFL